MPALSHRILLVDDAPLFLELEKRLLESRGYELETATSASEALEKLRERPADLVLLDQQMPEMDGADCCRIIKADAVLKGIPVILVTESREREDVRRALESGCDDFVVKPITDMVLLQKVDAVFDPVRRRKSPRMPVAIAVEYTEFEGLYQGTATELGQGGMLLAGPQSLARDTRIQISFTLPPPYGRKRIQTFGRIVYQRPGDRAEPDMGVEFIALDRESELSIEAMVRGHVELPRALAMPLLAGARGAGEEGGGELQGAGVPPDIGRRMEAILDELYHLESDKKRLISEYHDLARRYHELEAENIELARKVLESENENASLASLYVASYQLHMSLDFGSVLDTITQILVSLIGIDRFVLMFVSEDRTKLTVGFSYGMPEGKVPALTTGAQPIARWLSGGGDLALTLRGAAEGPEAPLAVIPLAIRSDLLGVIAVHGLVGHKEGFSKLDLKLFQLLSHHAATAIYCSRAYSESERKRRTFQEFIRMLTH